MRLEESHLILNTKEARKVGCILIDHCIQSDIPRLTCGCDELTTMLTWFHRWGGKILRRFYATTQGYQQSQL